MMKEEEIQDPECNSERWWELAAKHPLEAMSSALFLLLTLESPARWEQLQRENIGDWVDQAVGRLPFRNRHLFAADCAEHVLSLYERQYPNDRRVRDTIEARRRYANGQISDAEWEAAREVATAAAHDANDSSSGIYSGYAAVASAWSVALAAARSIHVHYLAADAAAYASDDVATYYTERLWQWERVQRYLRGEIK